MLRPAARCRNANRSILDALMRAEPTYEELIRRVREETLLTSCEALLEWDEETYMPPGGVENRSEQLALLAGLLHERGTDPQDRRAAGRAGEVGPRWRIRGSPAAVNVRELRREYDRYVRLPRRLVEDVARTTALAQTAWAKARAGVTIPELSTLAGEDRRAQAGRGGVRGLRRASPTTR